MSWQDLTHRISLVRTKMGAHQAFLLEEREQFYIVESGYVDLFAVVTDDRRKSLTRKPFVARIMPGKVFFGSPPLPVTNTSLEEGTLFAFCAVPSRSAVLLLGDRERLASQDDFDLDAVTLIDDWVTAASEFVSSYEPPLLRAKFAVA